MKDKEVRIVLAKPKWEAGKEKDFLKFMSRITGGRIALLSHVQDLDGVGCAKVVNEVIKPHLLQFVDYYQLDNSFIEQLKKEKITKVIITDIMMKRKEFILELQKHMDVLIIDHHPIAHDFNSNRVVFMNAAGFSATYLCYYLFSKIRNLEQYDWIVLCATISDFMFKKGKPWIKSVYRKYGDEFSIVAGLPRESGTIWDIVMELSLAIAYFKPKTERVYDSIGINFGDIGDLRRFSDAVKNELGVMANKFRKEKVPFRDGYFFQFECIFPIRSFLVTRISLEERNKTYIIMEKKGDIITLSARRQDGKIDLNKFLSKMTEGFENASAGGHKQSSGGSFPSHYLEEFKRRLLSLK